jgi:beta-glucosidase/6-phospho-beta-glucosidase/beta-galactosidase/ABC-type amino acid transport substrate-binding protein
MINPNPNSMLPFPESFMFGVATADHQCEAYDPDFEDIRDVWERRRAQTLRGKATDFWNRYPEDVELARSLGCKMFRFSIAWSRVEPRPGEFNEAAFDHYRQVIETIRAAGMEPFVTLHHFTWPLHVESRGGLTAPEFPSIFARYVTEVANRFGNQVCYWITFNEPSQLIYGYVKPWWERTYFMPPGMPPGATTTEQLSAVSLLMRNLFLGHTAARTILKRVNPDAQVGANPMLLGLPLWLQRLVDRNVTNLRRPEDLIAQGQRFTERTLLEQGNVDVVIATLTMNLEREDQVAFSEVYYVAGQTLLTKVNSAIDRTDKLAGQIVAVVKSSTAEGMFYELIPAANILSVDDYEEARRVLDFDQATAILADDTILLGIIQQYPEQYRLVGNRLTDEPYAAAVAKGNRYLLNAVDIAIRQFKESGAWAESFARHFPGQPIPEPPRLARRSTVADISGRKSPQEVAVPSSRSQRKTVLQRIQDRGYIIIAVKDNVPGFSYRDPKTGEFSGLEIDLARAVAQYIFNDPNKVVFKPTKTQQRIPLLRSIMQILDPILRPFGILSTSLTSNWWHLGMAGKLPEFLCPRECVGEQDFVGLDYYWGISSLRLNRIQKLMDAAFGRFNNAPVWPGVLYQMLKFHANLFPGKEIFIIENGSVEMADNIDRATYIRQHLREVQRAHQDGVKVAGYVCWSITSNREWGLKFDQNSDFGLFHIELDKDPDLKRVSTAAAKEYQEIIKRRSAL